ncbi:phage tail protein [Streptococcus cuniculi]|uniref:Antireceptor n=1 Tax=Streptococcus cuniculi TaxID=1432788 RepID=A0A4Y9JD94_9STRE|nr:phage tail protein [Streptococcus cuniculi]MBF0778188.1 phage tail protein [Streptococcus cuniculi]TFU97929.1 antireceptor [Streptococcus cuniculi]
MLLTIHDASLRKIGWIDNDKQDTLNFFDDMWTRDLHSGSSVFEFTAVKKEVRTDIGRDYLFDRLNERAFVSFEYAGKSYVFNVMEVEEDATTIRCYCENLNLELINEYANPYAATKALTFKEYCETMELIGSFSFLKIGRNDIASVKKPLEFTQQETKLARLLALAREFNAEIEFETELNADSTIKRFVMNAYHAHDEKHQGVGRKRDDLVMRYGKNMRGVRRKISKTNVFNVIYPVGKRSEVTKSKKTTVINPDGTTTVTEKVSVSDTKSTTTTTVYSTSGAVVSSKTVTATKNPDGTVSRTSSESKGSSTVTSTSSTTVKENPDKSTTKTTTVRKSDGTVQKTVVHTKKEEYPDQSTKTTVTTTKADRSVTERVTWRYPNGTSNTSSRLVKAGSSSSSTKVSKVDESSDEEFDLTELKDWSQKNAKGVQEFYKRGPAIYAPISVQLYPSTFTSDTLEDQWIRRDKEFDADSVEELNALAYQYLKEHCYPAITYSVTGFVDGDIGDTIRIEDDSFTDVLVLSARISKQKISFTNPSQNQTEISNIKALENKLSQNIQQRLDKLIEDAKPYFLRLTTSNGVIFKNAEGSSRVTPTLVKGIREFPNATFRFYWGEEVEAGKSFVVRANEVSDTKVLTVAAFIGNQEVARDTLTFVGVADGPAGPQGPQGEQGPPGTVDETVLTEIRTSIESKADMQITQEQLLLLSEQAALQKAELEALQSMSIIRDWVKAYKEFVEADEDHRAESEAAFVKASERIANIEKLGEKAQEWDFIDTYMRAQNEGLIIGDKQSATEILISDDRIAMRSAGKEVMWITQGVIHIDNGVFTKTIQIGRFRTEQYHANLDMNVIRYVGDLGGSS